MNTKKISEYKITEQEAYDVILALGKSGQIECEGEVKRFLSSPHGDLRIISMKVLVLYWGVMKYEDKIYELFKADPSYDVRMWGATCLSDAMLTKGTTTYYRDLLQAVFNIQEHDSVRFAAYNGLLKSQDVERKSGKYLKPWDDNINESMDWEWLKALQAKHL